jgi:Cdc6-like AAA superfamily ATPase
MESNNILNQILPMMVMKDGVKPKDIIHVIKTILVADIGVKAIPQILKSFKNLVFRKRSINENENFSLHGDKHIEKSASIQLTRLYADDKPTHANTDLFDALIWKLSDSPQTKYLKMASNGIYVIKNNDVIYLEGDIMIKMISVNFDEHNAIKDCCIEVFSNTLDLIKLKEYLNEMKRKYIIYKNNQLGEEQYYFDEIPQMLPTTIEGDIRYEMAQPHISFTMSKLYTNKSLKNVYGNAMHTVRQRVNFFMRNRRWYEDKGIPYTLGILMYGAPGCGKTSLIKGLSKDCNRHVFNLKLSENTTITQIQNIFYNERVNVVKDGSTHTYTIPIDKRLIVIEDIDCLSSIVLSREQKPAQSQSQKQEHALTYHLNDNFKNAHFPPDIDLHCIESMPYVYSTPSHTNSHATIASTYTPHTFASNTHTHANAHASVYNNTNANAKSNPQKLTLSVLLNILDGVLETPGRILIMTSNHPEKLDKALIRAGRIDLKVCFSHCKREEIKEMIDKITEVSCTMEDLKDVPEDFWSAAEVTQKIFENIDDQKKIIRSLIPI